MTISLEHNQVVASKPDPSSVSRKEVWKMFDRIAHRYDLLNRLLSLGQDVIWRRKMHHYLNAHDNQYILDLATGTGDQLLSMFRSGGKVSSGVGIDMSEKMLEKARKKLKNKANRNRIKFLLGDAVNINFEDNIFDAVTISFGIRNVVDVSLALQEMYRVLVPGGRAIILEFSLPPHPKIREMYLYYFRNVLPKLGGFISGDNYAYRYLNETVETFPYGQEFCNLMSTCGFKEVSSTPLTFGIASIYCGEKAVEFTA